MPVITISFELTAFVMLSITEIMACLVDVHDEIHIDEHIECHLPQ